MLEFEFINKILLPLTKPPSSLAKNFDPSQNLSDDVALLKFNKDFDLIVSKDIFIEDIHFLKSDGAKKIASKLLLTNLSDIASSGGLPIYYMLGFTKNSTLKNNRKLSSIKQFFMDTLRAWCDEPKTRQGKTLRKKEIAKVLQKDVQTIKNMYLYGQGSLDMWFKAMDYINHLKQDTIIQMYNSYPFIENKLNSLNEEELKLHRYIRELSPSELFLINRLIETGLKVNRSLK